MVKLIIDDLVYVTRLEMMLKLANIDFEVEYEERSIGIPKPYLRVNGVPLDLRRATTWIKEHSNL